MKRTLGHLGWVAVGVAVAGALVYAFLPQSVEVDVAPAARGPLLVTVDREGKTRVRDRYVVSAPLAGRLARIELHPGDPVKEGQTLLAALEPTDPALLDPRARAEAEARVRAAEESRKLAGAELRQANADLDRANKLLPARSISYEEFDRIDHRARAASFRVKIAEFELEQARAALLRVRPRSPGEEDQNRMEIRSPITGSVLEVYQESSRVVPAGAELLKLGDTAELECVIDVLSADAVKVQPGGRVLLEHWGGGGPLNGRVRRVEPAAFTKVSALGVEEQRVNVIVDFTDPRGRWERLGDAYRVEARIVVWEGEAVLQVPAGAVFRQGSGWAVFVNDRGRARLRPVGVGHSNGLQTEVVDGLAEGEQVIVHPSDRVQGGVAVRPRPR